MSNSIHTLCDKIIELDSKRTQGEWFNLGEECEIHAVEFQDNASDLHHVIHSIIKKNDCDFIIESANHAAKLARALKVALEKLDYIRDMDFPQSEPWDTANEALKEIEEIFK